MRRPLLTLACVLCALGCRGPGSTVPDAGRPRFVDVTDASGIVIETVCGDSREKLAIPETLGQGAAALGC